MTVLKNFHVRIVIVLLIFISVLLGFGSVGLCVYATDAGEPEGETDNGLTFIYLEGYKELYDQLGDSTLRELTLYWDAYGWPEEIGYAARGGGYTNAEDGADYRVTAEVELWNVGITCSEEEATEYLRPLISNKCAIRFNECEYTRTELRELFPEVVNDFKYNLAVMDMYIDGGHIHLDISMFGYRLFSAIAKAKYGTAVETDMYVYGGQDRLLGYDSNGNMNYPSYDIPFFDLFCIGAFILTLAFAITWLVMRKRVRKWMPKIWMRLALVGVFALTIVSAYYITAFAVKPPVAEYYSEWLSPYDDESKIIRLKTSRVDYNYVEPEPGAENEAKHEMAEAILYDIGRASDWFISEPEQLAMQKALAEQYIVEQGLEDTKGMDKLYLQYEHEARWKIAANLAAEAMMEKYRISADDDEVLEYAKSQGYDELALVRNESLKESLRDELCYEKLCDRLLEDFKPSEE